MRLRRFLQEPLLHFLLIGVALFVVHDKVAAPNPAGMTIVVSDALVDKLARDYEARWTRKASDQELAVLVESYLRDEILYREGTSLGLDRDDEMIKRRVRQKLEVIAEEQGAPSAPTDAALRAYMVEHPGRFLVPGIVSFEQVFFGDARVRVDLQPEIAAARLALANGADPRKLGQASVLPGRVETTAQNLVARDFGAEFARQLETAPVGQWSGPITSSFGVHLVRVTARRPAVSPELDEVRGVIAREWESERREISRNNEYRKLRSHYTVVIEAKKLAALAAQR